MIDIHQIDDTTFEVSVAGDKKTRHRVTVMPSYYRQLTGGQVPASVLVEKSFEFLLEREPNSAILSQFDLDLISDYFPEYEQEIREMLGS